MADRRRESEEATYAPEYFSAVLSTLRLDTVTDFDIFLRTKDTGEPVLYRERGLPFTEEVYERLLDHGVPRILLRTDQHTAYHRYLESNIRAVLSDAETPLDEKVELLYDCAQFVVHDILADPGDERVVPRSQELIDSVADFLLAEPGSFGRFLQATPLDYHVYTHSVNVFVYSMMLARRIGIGTEDTLKQFGLGALLHDVGKSRVRPETLNSPDRLTDDQWHEMKQHPVWGWDILQEHGVEDGMVLGVTRSHHEKLTGSGYPDALQGDAIPDYVRMVTVCDIFDALTTRRSYKDEIRSFAALKLMQNEMRRDLDAEIFTEFVHLMSDGQAPKQP